MKAMETSLPGWQKRYGTEEACTQALTRQGWPEGFRCPRCGHDHGYVISTRHSSECAKCHYQASLTAGTLFHSTNLPLTKWFWAIVGGRRSGGKRGRGTEGKPPVPMAIENRDKRAGFIAMQQVAAAIRETVAQFVQGHLPPGQLVHSDALSSLVEIGKTRHPGICRSISMGSAIGSTDVRGTPNCHYACSTPA